MNEAIDNLGELAGQDILIEGVLSFSFEDTSLTHWAKAERREGYGSSLWISTGAGSLQFDRQTCQRLSGKRVVIEGTLLQPDPRLGGCGHMSLWPGEILPRTLRTARRRGTREEQLESIGSSATGGLPDNIRAPPDVRCSMPFAAFLTFRQHGQVAAKLLECPILATSVEAASPEVDGWLRIEVFRALVVEDLYGDVNAISADDAKCWEEANSIPILFEADLGSPDYEGYIGK